MTSKSTIAQALRRHHQHQGLSYAHIADAISALYGNVSKTTVSNIITGDEAALNSLSPVIWYRVKCYLGMASDWDIYDTYQYTNIVATLEAAQSQSSIYMITGQTGVGKTTAYLSYQAGYKYVYVVTCAAEMNKKEFIVAIAEAMGLDRSGTKYKLISRIAERLKREDHPLVILDECGKLPTHFLSAIQTIYELTHKKAGFVLSGVSYLYDNLAKASSQKKVAMPELEGRIRGYTHLTTHPSQEDMRNIAILNGVNPADARKLAQDEDVRNFRDLYHAVQAHFADLCPAQHAASEPTAAAVATHE
jgi:DNA transposition AAA+ family ATPase